MVTKAGETSIHLATAVMVKGNWLFLQEFVWMPRESRAVQWREAQPHPWRSPLVEQASSRPRRLQTSEPTTQAKVTHVVV